MPPFSFDDFDRFYDSLSRRLSDPGWSWDETGETNEGDAGGPLVEVRTSDDEVLVFVDVAGYDEAHLAVTVAGDTLLLRANRPSTGVGSSPVWALRSSVVRAIPLPVGLDADAARTTVNNGVLTVTLPAGDAAVVDSQ